MMDEVVTMKLAWETLDLRLKTPFRTAHGASAERRNVLVRLGHGLGEAAGLAYHNESHQGIVDYLARAAALLHHDPDALDREVVLDRLRRLSPPLSMAGQAAIDMALHDLWGQQQGQPLWRLLGLNAAAAPPTSFTVGLDAPQAMASRARDSGMPIIKVKLGGEHDEQVVTAIRDATSARLRVDANAGWSRERAAALLPLLADLGVELVEQPLAVGDIQGLRWLRSQDLGVPIYVDESVCVARDVEAHVGAVDGVVVKLMKSGGIAEATKVIQAARASELQVMIGCMVESSLAVTAAAHLAPLCDHADLDGPLLVADDPFVGVRYQGARMQLPQGPGLGVTPRG
jgi:L-alanine-DL-glutamate epimerase-like enolase superfamily enzyme